MPINLDQTGPAHLLSTDDDGLILNGSPVISKSIHVSDIEPKTYFGDTNTKLLWLDTGVQGVSSFPNGGAANWILRTDGNGTVSWIPPSSLDATKFHYRASDNAFVSDPGAGYVRFPRAFLAGMSTTTNLVISGYDISNNLISSFINGLTAYGNSNRRGFIKIEKENDPNHFQIFEFKNITDNTGWFEIEVEIVRVEVGDENFPNNEPVSITFSVAGPEAITQDLTNYLSLTGTQTAILKTLSKPLLQDPSLIDSSFALTSVAIGSSGEITCESFDLSSVGIGLNGSFTCTASNFNIGDAIYISGSITGTGTITGYSSSGTTYYVIATNGTTQFTLSDTLGGAAITTSVGTSIGATFSRVIFDVNDAVRISGVNAGTGVIAGYDDTGSIYFITATNGIDTFTISTTLGGAAVTTTAGTVSGAMTFTSSVGSSITFEDAFPANGFETKLTVINASSDRKIILPDADTTLVGIDNAQIITNKTIVEPVIKDPEINITANDTNITLTSEVAVDFNSRFNTTDTNVFSWTTNLSYDGTTWNKDDLNRGAWRINKVVDTTGDVDNKIVIAYTPYDSNVEDNKFVFDGEGRLNVTTNITSTTTTSGSLVVAGGVGIAENVNIGGDVNITGIIDGGSIQSTPIGSVARSSGAFTTLSASGLFEVTDNTASTSQTTGAAVVAGGLGVGGSAYVNGPIYLNDLDALETELTGYSLVIQNPQAKLRVGPNYTSGAIDYIDILTQPDNPIITTTSDNLTIENAQATSLITLTAIGGSVVVSENTAASDKITGALKVAGGIGVELDIHADDIYVYGQTGLANTASQVVSIAATQTLTNKTLEAATLNDNVLTGTLEADGSTGIAGQVLSSTGTGVEWVNPVSNSAVVFYKASDQNFNNNPGIVTLPAGASIIVGSNFGDMDVGGTGVFTFTVTGTYQILINYSLTDINGGAAYPAVDFWVRKNGVDTVKYCQVLTNGSRRGVVTEYIDFTANDTVDWYINSTLRVNGGSPSVTGSRLTIIRVG